MRAMTLLLGSALALVPASSARGQQPSGKARDFFESHIRPVLVTHCYGCHSKEAAKPKGNFRLDQLSLDFADRDSRDAWLAVAKRIQAGEMPPKAKPRPPQKALRAVLDWIDAGVKTADARRAAEGRVVLRRLNRVEYENTVRDLLGVPVELKDLLPLDGSANGFDNVADALHVSSFLMEKYLEGAERALNLAIANGPQPPVVKKRDSLKDTHHIKTTQEKVNLKRDDGTVVLFSSSAWQAVVLSPFYPPHRGTYRFRISASGFQSAGKPVTYRVDAGTMLMAGKNHLVGYFDAPADKPAVLEFLDHLEARSTIRLLPYGLAMPRPSTRSAPTSTRARGWPCSGWRWKVRCTTSGRPRATAASSATCRKNPRPFTTTANEWRSFPKTPRRTPNASCAASPAAPFGGRSPTTT